MSCYRNTLYITLNGKTEQKTKFTKEPINEDFEEQDIEFLNGKKVRLFKRMPFMRNQNNESWNKKPIYTLMPPIELKKSISIKQFYEGKDKALIAELNLIKKSYQYFHLTDIQKKAFDLGFLSDNKSITTLNLRNRYPNYSHSQCYYALVSLSRNGFCKKGRGKFHFTVGFDEIQSLEFGRWKESIRNLKAS